MCERAATNNIKSQYVHPLTEATEANKRLAMHRQPSGQLNALDTIQTSPVLRRVLHEVSNIIVRETGEI